MTLDTIKQRLRDSLLIAGSGKSALDTAAHLASELSQVGNWSGVGEPIPANTDPRQQGHLARTLLLAKACRLAPGELLGGTIRAFDWWLSRDYCPTDWYLSQVIVPRLVGEIALLIEDDLSVGAWGKVIEILTRSRWAHWVKDAGWTEWTGSPVVEIAYNTILRGCLENSPALCEGAFRRAFRNVRWAAEADAVAPVTVDPAESLPPFIYGTALIRNYVRLMTLVHGTPWQAPVESVKAFVSYLLDFQQWVLWRDVPEQGSNLFQASEGLENAIAQLAQLGNPPRRDELADMADRLGGKGKALVGHRHFWRSRFAIHQRPTFYCSLAGTRPRNQEAGLSSHYHDVFQQSLHFLRTGTEYAGLVEGRSLLSSTEVQSDQHGPSLNPCLEPVGHGGGISEGEYGMATSAADGEGHQGKRAWFFFDDSVVCLSADLPLHTDYKLPLTRINRCRVDGSVVVDGGVAGSRRVLAKTQQHRLRDIQRVEHGGFLYYFPKGARIVADLKAAGDREGSKTHGEEVFTLSFDHERQAPSNSSAWFVLPLDDDPASSARVEGEIRQVDILANNSVVQAAGHQGAKVVCVAFWEPSVLELPAGGRIAANSPCMILCREDPDGFINVTIANLLVRASVVHVEYQGRCVCFELPGGADAGRSFRRRL